MDPGLIDLAQAYAKRRMLAKRLAEQDRLIGHLARQARKANFTWNQIGVAGGVSDVMARKVAQRPD